MSHAPLRSSQKPRTVPFLLLSLQFLMPMSATLASKAPLCPDVCFCNVPSKIVYCSRRGLKTIPDGIPTNTIQLNLNVNGFESGFIRRSNISRYIGLEHLYMSECELESIEVGAFSDLVNLKWLDLSNNRLKVIEELTFQGLSLQHLFISGNRDIRLLPDSFASLSTTGLYLQDCSLSEIHLDQFLPLNSTIRYLWLNGNGLEKIDGRFEALFARLSHLRLGFNPLHCNCETIWLKEFYDKNGDIFRGAMPPSCLTPLGLRGRFFNELSFHDFRCQTPMFTKIEAHFATRQGRIKCSALGEPAPSLYWIQPSGKTTRFNPSGEDQVEETEAVLHLNWNEESNSNSNPSGMYICIANNEAGNVTLTVNIPWPQRPRTPSLEGQKNDVLLTWPPLASHPSFRPTLQPMLISNNIPASNIQYRLLGDSLMLQRSSPSVPPRSLEDWLSGQNYTSIELARHRVGPSERLFTASQLAWAVVGTHLCTLFLCLMAVVVFYRLHRRKCPSAGSRSSYDQTPDMSGQCGHLTPYSAGAGGTGESVYLNGVRRHPLKSYVDISDQHTR